MTQPGEGMPPQIIEQVPWNTPEQTHLTPHQEHLITGMPERLRPDAGAIPVETNEPIITEVPADIAAKHTGDLRAVPAVIDTMPEKVRPTEAAAGQIPETELIQMPTHLKPAGTSGEQPEAVHFGQPVAVERRPQPASELFDPQKDSYGGYTGHNPVRDAQKLQAAQTQQGMIAALGEQHPQQ